MDLNDSELFAETETAKSNKTTTNASDDYISSFLTDLEFKGSLTAVKAACKKLTESSRDEEPVMEVSIMSSDIDYEKLARASGGLYQYVSSTLLNVQPTPFDSVNFPIDARLEINIKRDNEKQLFPDYGIDYNGILTDIEVKMKINIPHYQFKFVLPQNTNSDLLKLMNNVKEKLFFTISRATHN